jgi:predicted nuclease with TOPRIM domain
MNDEHLEAELERLEAHCQRMASDLVDIADDHSRLFHENARLKAEVERLDALCKQVMAQHSDISCENVMLRKAGDAMAKQTEFFQKRWDADELCQEVEAWNAAKEGKGQP